MTQDFDFDRSVNQAWRRFTLRLGEVLSMMDETEPLTLQPCDGAEGRWQVRFCQPERGRLQAQVPLEDEARHQVVTPEQAAGLQGLGWQADEGGWSVTVDQDDCGDLAAIAVEALRRVFLVEHPVFLDANVLDEILQEPTVLEAGTQAAVAGSDLVLVGLDEVQLTAAVAEELSGAVGVHPMRDQDGDFAVRVGSTMIFVRIPSDGKEVRLFSVLVHDVSGRSRAAEVLNDVNSHSRWVKFYLVRDKIMVTMSILASPFVPAHLRQAITEMANVADGVDDLLAASLQGKTTFPEN